MLSYLDDLESDFSVFHRVDDIYAMDGRTFFARAFRLFAYNGCVRTRLAVEIQERETKAADWKNRLNRNSASDKSAERVTNNLSDPAFAGLVEFG